MLPKTGKKFPGGNDRENGRLGYAAIIAGALANELGETHRAAKVLMGWTGAGERTVKHWLAGLHGPRGDHLLVLMQESDAVFEAVLTAINRRDAAIAARMLAAQRSLQEVAILMQPDQVRPPAADEPAAAARAPSAPEDRMTVKMTVIVTVIMTVKAPKQVQRSGLRQSWFLEALRAGRHVGATELAERWSISETTARRDVAILKAKGLIEFVGSRRSGRYRPMR